MGITKMTLRWEGRGNLCPITWRALTSTIWKENDACYLYGVKHVISDEPL